MKTWGPDRTRKLDQLCKCILHKLRWLCHILGDQKLLLRLSVIFSVLFRLCGKDFGLYFVFLLEWAPYHVEEKWKSMSQKRPSWDVSSMTSKPFDLRTVQNVPQICKLFFHRVEYLGRLEGDKQADKAAMHKKKLGGSVFTSQLELKPKYSTSRKKRINCYDINSTRGRNV